MGAFIVLFVDMEPATYIPNDYLLTLPYFFTHTYLAECFNECLLDCRSEIAV